MHHDHSAPPAATAVERLVAALADPGRTFSRDQVLYLIAADRRWNGDAVRAEVTELNLDAIARGVRAPAFSEAALRREGYRRTARREWDTAAVHPWRGDHPGGELATDWDGSAWGGVQT